MESQLLSETELQRQARSLSRPQRHEIIAAYSELQLHKQLKELLKNMQPDYTVEVTHRAGELGKDLVMVKRDKLTFDVIGIVVKCGDITGKTAGDVDQLKERVKAVFNSQEERRLAEIESQVEQVISHPSEMPTVFINLPVNKVLVILAGRLSNQARLRLQAELKVGQVYDVEWLIDSFTDYYPQAFYDGKAIDFLQLKIQALETRSWLIKSQKNLTEYFVEPLVSTVSVPHSVDGESLIKMLERRPMPFSALEHMVSNKSKFILAGDPGTGKSAALAMLAIKILRDAYLQASKTGQSNRPIKIPIFLTAERLLAADKADELLSIYCEHSEIRNRFVPLVLLVDGLDEVNTNRREEVITKAKVFAEELGCALVITSRKVDAVNFTPTGFDKFELLPFEVGQARRMFERLLVDSKHLTALQDSLESIKYQIPITPLSIVLLMRLVQEHNEVPASVTELYDRYVDAVLGREDKEKGINVLFDYFTKKGFISNLAYTEFMAKDRLHITKAEFDAFVVNYGKRYGWREESVGQFLADIERAGVLSIQETVEFRHRSFLDYFTAFYIFNKQDEFDNLTDFLVTTYFDGLWEDVTFFYIGLKREISEKTLNKIFEHESDGLLANSQKFLVGRLLQAGWFSPTDTKSSGIQKAFQLTPSIKQEFLNITEKHSIQIPRIYADFFLLVLSDVSFRSGFLKTELRSYYDSLTSNKTSQGVLARVPVLWSLKPFINHDEFKEIVTGCAKSIEEASEISPEEKAGALVLLRAINLDDKNIKKTLTKKLKELGKEQPGVFSELLPTRRRGFRK